MTYKKRRNVELGERALELSAHASNNHFNLLIGKLRAEKACQPRRDYVDMIAFRLTKLIN